MAIDGLGTAARWRFISFAKPLLVVSVPIHPLFDPLLSSTRVPSVLEPIPGCLRAVAGRTPLTVTTTVRVHKERQTSRPNHISTLLIIGANSKSRHSATFEQP